MLKYSVTYLDNSKGFSLFNFLGLKNIRCEHCNKEKAVLTVTNRNDKTNKIDLCLVCYNDNSISDLLMVPEVNESSE